MKTRAKDRLTLLAWAAVVILTMVGKVAASSGTFQAFGYVLDTSGKPIVGVDVTGDDYVGDFYTFKTDTNGYYSVDFDADGNYRITVSCAQLSARGYDCAPGSPITIADGAVGIDFTVTPSPLHVTNTFLPRGNIGMLYSAQLAAAGGLAPYSWRLAVDSAALPEGLSLSAHGLISGKPMAASGATLNFEVRDANLAVTNKILALTVNPIPALTPTLWLTNRFSLFLTGGSNQNYTIQASLDLTSTNWTSLFVTNHRTANAFTVIDSRATNSQRSYRVLIGP